MLTRPVRHSHPCTRAGHPSRAPDLLVDGQAQFLGGPLPRCVAGSLALSRARALSRWGGERIETC